ncbi:hypothetical protein BDB01DRAFT_791272 [Pilobolus umbonatus]|nr:hypothetical protein BDB01DRAFT_791272 [Pilobolus umbonatus]
MAQSDNLAGLLYFSDKVRHGLSQVADDNKEVAAKLMMYGSSLGEDMTDVTSKLGSLFIQWSNILLEYAACVNQFNETLKPITLRDEKILSGEYQAMMIRNTIDRLQNLPERTLLIERNIAKYGSLLDTVQKATDIERKENQEFTRRSMHLGLTSLMNGMHTMAGKTDVIPTYGTDIVDEINRDFTKYDSCTPYISKDKTQKIYDDATHAISIWPVIDNKLGNNCSSNIPIRVNNNGIQQSPSIPATVDHQLTSPSSSPSISASSSTSSKPQSTEKTPFKKLAEDPIMHYSFHKPNVYRDHLNNMEASNISHNTTDDLLSPEIIVFPSSSHPVNSKFIGGFPGFYVDENKRPLNNLLQKNSDSFRPISLPPLPYKNTATQFDTNTLFNVPLKINTQAQGYNVGGFVLPNFSKSTPNYRSPVPSGGTRLL